MYGRCDECDAPLLWGGMEWVPCTDRNHEYKRQRAMKIIHNQLLRLIEWRERDSNP